MNVLKFFAAGDLVVNQSLLSYILKMPNLAYEATLFYNFQIAMEDIHSLAYKDMLDLFTSFYTQTPISYTAANDSVQTDIFLNRKIAWINKWKKSSYSNIILALAATECILFSSSFAIIFHFKKKGYFPGLCEANEYISRDEGLHFKFGVAMYESLSLKDSTNQILTIALEAYAIEKNFINYIYENGNFIGLTSYQLLNYVQFITDFFLSSLGEKKYFNISNPLPYMENISLEGKSNMFERKVTEYRRINSSRFFTTEEDF